MELLFFQFWRDLQTSKDSAKIWRVYYVLQFFQVSERGKKTEVLNFQLFVDWIMAGKPWADQPLTRNVTNKEMVLYMYFQKAYKSLVGQRNETRK